MIQDGSSRQRVLFAIRRAPCGTRAAAHRAGLADAYHPVQALRAGGLIEASYVNTVGQSPRWSITPAGRAVCQEATARWVQEATS